MGAAGAGFATARQKPFEESVTASATSDRTPQVGIVLSSFKGSTDHDGTEVRGLADPRPADADLTTEQIDAMVRKAIELGRLRDGGLHTIIGPEDWVVIKPNIVACHGLKPEDHDGGLHHPYIHGTVTDLRVVKSVIAYLVERKRGLRFTIAEGSGEWLPREKSKSAVDGWTTEWGGAFDGLSYKKMIEDFSKRYPKLQFDLADLNFEECLERPVQGKAAASKYFIPKTIQECDRIISIAPLKTHLITGVTLSVKNYFGIGPGSKYGFPKAGLHSLGHPDEVMTDLFSFHPADYAILGGSWGVEGDGPYAPGGSSIHHNVIIAGANAVAVDAVGASVMGFKPAELPYLALLEKRGYGIRDTDSIWTRGNEIEEARRNFRKPRHSRSNA